MHASNTIAPPDPGQPHGVAPRQPRYRVLKAILWILLGTFALVLGLAALLVAGGNRDESEQVPASTDEAVAPPVADVITEFAEAWALGDWTSLGEVATGAVVASAQAINVDGMAIEVVGSPSDGQAELLVVSGDGPALLYRVTMATVDENSVVVDLVPAGDAG